MNIVIRSLYLECLNTSIQGRGVGQQERSHLCRCVEFISQLECGCTERAFRAAHVVECLKAGKPIVRVGHSGGAGNKLSVIRRCQIIDEIMVAFFPVFPAAGVVIASKQHISHFYGSSSRRFVQKQPVMRVAFIFTSRCYPQGPIVK